MGNDAWSVPALQALVAGTFPPALVVTRPPRPLRRGSATAPTPVARAARDLELPVFETDRVRSEEGVRRLRNAAPDFLVVVAFGEILTPEILALPAKAAVNVHLSLLPILRGAAPVQHALIQGLRETGVSTMQMDEGLDTGPVLLQRKEPILPDDDAASLGARLATIGGELAVASLRGLLEGTVRPTPQDQALATWAPPLTAADRELDIAAGATSVVARVRGLAPEPGAVLILGEGRLKVLRAAAREGTGGKPGSVVSIDPLVLATSDGDIELTEVVPSGRGRMSGSDFARGAKVAMGQILVATA
jgi:methionyl-tRNA formyltransferase